MTLQVPLQIGTTAQQWDEQHLDVAAAGLQVGGAGAGGFTTAVRASAQQFLTAWAEHCETLATQAETQADGLRATLAEIIDSDQVSALEAITLRGLLEERR